MKYRRGGMMDILFIAHYLTLLHAHRYKSLPHPDVALCLENLVKKKVLAKNTGQTLIESYTLAQGVQGFLRLTAELPFHPAKSSHALKAALAQSVLKGEKTPGFKKLEGKLDRLMQKVSGYFLSGLFFYKASPQKARRASR
jgi:glutamate-ammonia-ligase adenylyltransferase